MDANEEASTPMRPTVSDETLVAALRRWGLRYLSGGYDDSGDLTPRALVDGLSRSADPRVRNSLAILLAVHPEFDPVLADLVSAAADSAHASELRLQHVAAVCLQRMWWTLLREHRPNVERLQDRYAAELGLSSPDVRHGKVCLSELSDRSPFNLFASYEGLMRNQLRHALNGANEPAPAG